MICDCLRTEHNLGESTCYVHLSVHTCTHIHLIVMNVAEGMDLYLHAPAHYDELRYQLHETRRNRTRVPDEVLVADMLSVLPIQLRAGYPMQYV